MMQARGKVKESSHMLLGLLKVKATGTSGKRMAVFKGHSNKSMAGTSLMKK